MTGFNDRPSDPPAARHPGAAAPRHHLAPAGDALILPRTRAGGHPSGDLDLTARHTYGTPRLRRLRSPEEGQ